MTTTNELREPTAGRAIASRLVAPAMAGALLSLLSAGIHFNLIGDHFEEWWGYGVFFVAAAAGQAALAVVVLLRRATWVLLIGILGNLAILGMYVLSRTNGPPLGPHAGTPEDVSVLDVACATAEVGAIASLVMLLPGRVARHTATALAIGGAAVWVARFTGVLL
jgi:hypothetical protein